MSDATAPDGQIPQMPSPELTAGGEALSQSDDQLFEGEYHGPDEYSQIEYVAVPNMQGSYGEYDSGFWFIDERTRSRMQADPYGYQY